MWFTKDNYIPMKSVSFFTIVVNSSLTVNLLSSSVHNDCKRDTPVLQLSKASMKFLPAKILILEQENCLINSFIIADITFVNNELL